MPVFVLGGVVTYLLLTAMWQYRFLSQTVDKLLFSPLPLPDQLLASDIIDRPPLAILSWLPRLPTILWLLLLILFFGSSSCSQTWTWQCLGPQPLDFPLSTLTLLVISYNFMAVNTTYTIWLGFLWTANLFPSWRQLQNSSLSLSWSKG